MTLNDCMNCHFTLNFHSYELVLMVSRVFYLFTVESVFSVYIRVTSGDVGSSVADRDPQKNLESAEKNCGSFVDTTSSES